MEDVLKKLEDALDEKKEKENTDCKELNNDLDNLMDAFEEEQAGKAVNDAFNPHSAQFPLGESGNSDTSSDYYGPDMDEIIEENESMNDDDLENQALIESYQNEFVNIYNSTKSKKGLEKAWDEFSDISNDFVEWEFRNGLRGSDGEKIGKNRKK